MCWGIKLKRKLKENDILCILLCCTNLNLATNDVQTICIVIVTWRDGNISDCLIAMLIQTMRKIKMSLKNLCKNVFND